MGGGGDVVGALATAAHCRLYDGAAPVLGGVSWERQPIDPEPGPRAAEEIEDAHELAPGVLLAEPQTRVRGSEVRFAESRMAEVLGQQTVLIDVHPGAAVVAHGLTQAIAQLEADLVVFVDVGGDVLAHGDEPGLRSPLCDAVMLAVLARLHAGGVRALLGSFGLGCDAGLTAAGVRGRVGRGGARG